MGNPRSVLEPSRPSRGRQRAAAFGLVLALVFLLLAAGTAAAGDKKKEKLPERYREWLERDVAYIISKEEKETFLQLTRDEDRDKFIEQFWEIRNPTLGSPANEFKNKHYRCIEYANERFGHESGLEGWRTDRGRVYITLGPPQQIAYYTSLQKLRPVEIWFYSSSHPALPPFFYVMFYQRENIGDFRMYSPYFDGPEKLITTGRTTNDRVAALHFVEEAAGREVARISLSLIPDEPVDLQTATSSLQSDVILSAIRNLANHPLNKLDLEQRRRLMESVTHRLIVEGEILQALTVPLCDPEGNTSLHYLLRLARPEDFALGQSNDGRYYYSAEVTTRVSGPDNRLIFAQTRALSRYVDNAEFDQIKSKVFGYEGRLPLPPGKYKVEFLLTNLLKHTAFRKNKEVVVPDVPTDGMRLTEPVPFSTAEAVDPMRSGFLPFSAAGLKFTPLAGHQVQLAPGQDLNVFYQIWAPPGDPRRYRGKRLLVEYAYGRPGAQGESKVIRDEVLKEQFDPHGLLLNGKRIPLGELPTGNYLLTITLTDPETQKRAYATLPFRISGLAAPPLAWDAYDEAVFNDVRLGTFDYQRGLCYLALGEKDRAIEWFRTAWQKNPANGEARARLVELYFARQEFDRVAALYDPAGITNQIDAQTILRMAESLEKTGETHKAISLLESAIKVKTDSRLLYLALATYYLRSGDLQKAAELERKGKALTTPPTTP